MLCGMIVRMNLRLGCVMENVGHEIMQFCQAFIVMLEQFKCGELTSSLCRSLPKIGVFDQ